jgi:hypothetical protein
VHHRIQRPQGGMLVSSDNFFSACWMQKRTFLENGVSCHLPVLRIAFLYAGIGHVVWMDVERPPVAHLLARITQLRCATTCRVIFLAQDDLHCAAQYSHNHDSNRIQSISADLPPPPPKTGLSQVVSNTHLQNKAFCMRLSMNVSLRIIALTIHLLHQQISYFDVCESRSS